MEPGLTLNQFASIPFCPPEADDGSFTYTRDVFGFAALAVQCLHDQRLHTHEALFAALDDVDVPQEVLDILTKALSKTADDRQKNAAVLLAELDPIGTQREQAWVERQDVYLVLTNKAWTNLLKELPGKTKYDIQSAVAGDLNLQCGIAPYQGNSDFVEQFSFYGAEFWYHAVLHQNKAQVVILNAGKVSPSILEERREKAYVPPFAFKFDQPREFEHAKSMLLDLREGLARHLAEARAQEFDEMEQELFRRWAAILKVKSDIEREKEQPISYNGYIIKENRVHLRLVIAPSDDLIGQTRLINADKHLSSQRHRGGCSRK